MLGRAEASARVWKRREKERESGKMILFYLFYFVLKLFCFIFAVVG